MKRIIVLGMLLTFVSACSGGFGTMDRIMQSWEGATLDEVVSQWGYPSGQQEFNGRTIYHWDRNATMTLPSSTTGTANVIGNTAYINTVTYGGGSSNWACRRSLEVDENGGVVSWQWGGNNCPFADVAMGYQHWEREGSN
ncbi:hypothetical protein N8222_09170 [Oceanospirillaceae bacterium]|nr:hypothetical protein [Oceanospirillaceae bacterium]